MKNHGAREVSAELGATGGGVVARLPEGRSVLRGRSACPHCGTVLGFLDLVPILGWTLARGRCRHCGAAVSWWYPAIEVAALAIAAWSLAVLPGWLAWAGCLLGWSLIALAAIWRPLNGPISCSIRSPAGRAAPSTPDGCCCRPTCRIIR